METEVAIDVLKAVMPVEHPMALLEAPESLDAEVDHVLEVP